MEPIRVLHENVIMDVGGIECLLMNLYRNIDRDKVQFDFMVHRDKEGYFDREIESLGGRLYRCEPFNPFHHRKYLNSMKQVFRSHPEYEIVHAHSDLNMWPLRLAKEAGIPVRIAHCHNMRTTVDLKRMFMEYEKLSLKRYCTQMFACSEAAAVWLYGGKAVGSQQIVYVRNGIEPEKYRFNRTLRDQVRREFGLENRFVIGHVGRFAKEKNHAFLLDVFRVVHQINPNTVLLLVGTGELLPEMRRKTEALELEDNVIFAGVRSDVPELMQAMDVFVFPSLYEGLGIALIEAQAAGLPCVVSDTVPWEADITELVERLPLSSAREWADRILRDRDGCQRADTLMNIRAAGYDIRDTAKKLEKFYLQFR